MTQEVLPSTAPEPEPSPRPFGNDPRSSRDRWQLLLAQNWQECDPKYWLAKPSYRFRFATTDLMLMSDLCVSGEEREAVYRLRDDLHLGVLGISRSLRMPYALVEWLLAERKRERCTSWA